MLRSKQPMRAAARADDAAWRNRWTQCGPPVPCPPGRSPASAPPRAGCRPRSLGERRGTAPTSPRLPSPSRPAGRRRRPADFAAARAGRTCLESKRPPRRRAHPAGRAHCQRRLRFCARLPIISVHAVRGAAMLSCAGRARARTTKREAPRPRRAQHSRLGRSGRLGRRGLAVAAVAAVVLVLLGTVAYAAVRPANDETFRELTRSGRVRIKNSHGGDALVGMQGMLPGDGTSGTVKIGNASKVRARFYLGLSKLVETPGSGGGRLSYRLVLTVKRLSARHRPAARLHRSAARDADAQARRVPAAGRTAPTSSRSSSPRAGRPWTTASSRPPPVSSSTGTRAARADEPEPGRGGFRRAASSYVAWSESPSRRFSRRFAGRLRQRDGRLRRGPHFGGLGGDRPQDHQRRLHLDRGEVTT